MAVALGDVDADGSIDLVAGAPNGRNSGRVGRVFVRRGPIDAGPELLLDDTTADVAIASYGAEDALGQRLLLAEVSGDAKLDLVLGAPHGDQPSTGAEFAGSVHVLVGEVGNRPPVCSVTPPERLACGLRESCPGGRVVRLDASASRDPDLDIAEFRWTIDCDGTSQVLSGPIVDACVPTTCSGDCGVSVTVVDARGNSAACATVIGISDEAAPTLTASSLHRQRSWPPNHDLYCFMKDSWSPTAIDDCDPNPTWRLVSCLSDQPSDGLGDGRTALDCRISSDGAEACVRAERSGVLGDRHVVLWGVARDSCGRESFPAIIGEILVPHDRGDAGHRARRGVRIPR